ncbi:type II toxin-antitoxin system RelE/ParE family toxin [Ensifer soli]|uniref:type II toxin-antitoxin system RelE/ParE family toxin n=1 Tax=Ciceribacter sp. sgz301302 TaxID=3342379 RepID=UPI0035B9F94E
MAHKVVFRPIAAADLKRIYLDIADKTGHERAGGYVTRIEAACLSLDTFPERGTVRDHILPGLRLIGFEHSAAIAFRVVSDDLVEVLRILKRGEDMPDDWSDA